MYSYGIGIVFRISCGRIRVRGCYFVHFEWVNVESGRVGSGLVGFCRRYCGWWVGDCCPNVRGWSLSLYPITACDAGLARVSM